jgi:dTDP-4-amino-4,6-dideoxygalactose transaminase
LITALERASVGFGIHYPEPVHLMQAYGILGQGKGALPVSEQSCETVLSIPLFEGMEKDAARWVARTVLDAG